MVDLVGGGSGKYDYVQSTQPTDPEARDQWLDPTADPNGDGTAEGELYIYGTDGEWYPTGVESHKALTGVEADDHHSYPIPTGGIVDGAVTAAKAAFDYVTPTEFNSHVSDETNPHNVTDDQTGGAARPLIYDKSVLAEGPVIGSVPDGSLTLPQDGTETITILNADVSAVSQLWLHMEVESVADQYVRIKVNGNTLVEKTVKDSDDWTSLSATYGVQDIGTATVIGEFESFYFKDVTVNYRDATARREKQVVDV